MKIFTKYNLSILFLLSLLLIQQSIIIDQNDQLNDLQYVQIPKVYHDAFELGRITGCADINDSIKYTITISSFPPNQRIEYYKNKCGDIYCIIDGETIQESFYVDGE